MWKCRIQSALNSVNSVESEFQICYICDLAGAEKIHVKLGSRNTFILQKAPNNQLHMIVYPAQTPHCLAFCANLDIIKDKCKWMEGFWQYGNRLFSGRTYFKPWQPVHLGKGNSNLNNIPTTMSTTRLLEVQFNKIMWLISISNKTIQNLQNEITKTNKSIKLKNSELKKLKQKRVRKYKNIQEK